MDIEKICEGKKLLAVIVRGNAQLSGMNFFSEDRDFLQFGVNVYEQGAHCRPHIHIVHRQAVDQSQEVVHVVEGSLELSFYSDDGRKLAVRVLKSRDTVFLNGCGHGLTMLEPTKIVEVKQGPYFGPEQDKRFL